MSPANRHNAPDSELLRLCDQFHRLRAEGESTRLDDVEGFLRLRSTRRTVAGHIIRTRPVTDAGRRAAAEVAIRMLDDGEYPAADPQL